jgi:cytidylate kinase
VSGDYKSGKSIYAAQLASALDLEHFSMRILKNAHEPYVNWSKILRKEDNQTIDHVIVDTARKGNCILDFRFSALLCSLHSIPYVGIWITASFEKRIGGNALYWGKSYEEAECILHEREKEELRICRELYKKDFRDPGLYHIFIDTSSIISPLGEPVDISPLVFLYLDEIKEKLKV